MKTKTGALLSGRYRLDSRLAIGGMGEVWRGYDEVLSRPVACKIMHPQLSADQGFLHRFRAEARHTAGLDHPGIASVYDYGETDESDGPSRAYLVMQLIDGEPLSDLLHRVGRLPVDTTLDLIAQTAEALQSAHDAGIVHRDVKPANLMICHDKVTGANTVVVADFGIAHASGSAEISDTGAVYGTAAYLSPEQATGKDPIPASDQYSLGVVAYLCLTGRRPFNDENPTRLALAHMRDKPPALPSELPVAARALVTRAMSKDPRARFGTMLEFAAAARAAEGGVVAPRVRPRPSPKPRRGTVVPGPSPVATNAAAFVGQRQEPPRRRTGGIFAVSGAAVLVTALVVGAAFAINWTAEPPAPRQVAAPTDTSGDPTAPLPTPSTVIPPTLPPFTPSPVPNPSLPKLPTAGPKPPGVPTKQPTPGAPVTPPSKAPKIIVLNEQDYLGRPYAEVKSEIEAKGLKVELKKLKSETSAPNRVNGVTPTRVEEGGTVTVYYQPGPKRASAKKG